MKGSRKFISIAFAFFLLGYGFHWFISGSGNYSTRGYEIRFIPCGGAEANSIKGLMINSEGAPVAGETIMMRDGSGQNYAVTDEWGRFSMGVSDPDIDRVGIDGDEVSVSVSLSKPVLAVICRKK